MPNPQYSPDDFAGALQYAIKKELMTASLDSVISTADYNPLLMIATSTGDKEDYLFDVAMGVPQDVTKGGYPQYGVSKDQKYTLTNKEYGAEYRIGRALMEDDAGRNNFIGLHLAAIAGLMEVRVRSEFVSTVAAGSSSLCHDGQYYFDTDHTSGSKAGNQKNSDYNKLVSTVDLAASVQNIATVEAAFRGFKNEEGHYFNNRLTHILTGTGDTGVAWDIIVNSPTLPGLAGTTFNPYYQKVEVIHMPEIANPIWYGFDCSKAFKPFIFQRRTATEADVFPPDKSSPDYLARVRARWVIGYGPWWLGIVGDGS